MRWPAPKHAPPAAAGTALLASLWPFGVCAQEIEVDGRIDAAEWSAASSCDDWRRTAPFAGDQPPYRNQLLLQSTASGLAVAFVLEHPSNERRLRVRTPRDAEHITGDYVSLIVDFDGRGQLGYEFSIVLGGGVRDGIVTNQNQFDYDWDGAWTHAVAETDESWSVEVLIPWSAVSMRPVNESTRTIGVYASRSMAGRDERYACPGIASDDNVFLASFKRLQIDQREAAAEFEVEPYGTVIRDLITDESEWRAGLDVRWKLSPRFSLAATLNPDFGQVESDELVVDFSAIETVFTDKRPFFTENEGVFDLRTPANGQLIYTRRIGAASDDSLVGTTDIDGALKVTGDAGALTYGAFVVQEEEYLDYDGRRFAAGRLAASGEQWRIGYLGSWVDRPLLAREAFVNAIDYEWTHGRAWRLAGQAVRSDIDVNNEGAEGYLAWAQADFHPTQFLSHTLKALHIDDRFDMNDLGYMERNALEQVEWDTRRRTSGGEADRVNGEVQRVYLYYRENTDGERLPSRLLISRDVQYRSAWRAYHDVRFITSGVDDLLSRGNGPVLLDERWAAYCDFTTPRWGNWEFAFGGYFYEQGVSEHTARLQLLTNWYPTEQLRFRLDLAPYVINDWLLWEDGNLFGSYEGERLDFDFRVDWIPDPRHELRLKWQWIGVHVEPRQAYRTDPSGRLLRSDERLSSFTVSNVGLQLRYRFEIAPQSELFVVYGRGGFDITADDERGLDDLYTDMSDVRDSDQFLIKVRYRL